VCCARLRVAVRPATFLAPFQDRSSSLRWSKSRKKDVTVLVRKWSLRTRLRSPNPNRRTHLTGKGSHDHGGHVRLFVREVVSVLQGLLGAWDATG
jgi:hypothetical protein